MKRSAKVISFCNSAGQWCPKHQRKVQPSTTLAPQQTQTQQKTPMKRPKVRLPVLQSEPWEDFQHTFRVLLAAVTVQIVGGLIFREVFIA